jgi:hypothetical protein
MQVEFKTKAKYIEWRSHWRRNIAELSTLLRDLKKEARKPTNNAIQQSLCQSDIAYAKQLARSLMMAREAADEAYWMRKEAEQAQKEAA